MILYSWFWLGLVDLPSRKRHIHKVFWNEVMPMRYIQKAIKSYKFRPSKLTFILHTISLYLDLMAWFLQSIWGVEHILIIIFCFTWWVSRVWIINWVHPVRKFIWKIRITRHVGIHNLFVYIIKRWSSLKCYL